MCIFTVTYVAVALIGKNGYVDYEELYLVVYFVLIWITRCCTGGRACIKCLPRAKPNLRRICAKSKMKGDIYAEMLKQALTVGLAMEKSTPCGLTFNSGDGVYQWSSFKRWVL